MGAKKTTKATAVKITSFLITTTQIKATRFKFETDPLPNSTLLLDPFSALIPLVFAPACVKSPCRSGEDFSPPLKVGGGRNLYTSRLLVVCRRAKPKNERTAHAKRSSRAHRRQ